MDVKGTGALTDMVDNVMVVHRNKLKEQNLAIIEAGETAKDARGRTLTREEVLKGYDAFLCCDKHRENGADAEGMYGLFFDRRTSAYVEDQP
jgi:twinkle protein